jgi:hypothetical protein
VLDSLVLELLGIACFFPLNRYEKWYCFTTYNVVHKYHLLKHCISTS